MTAMVLLSDWMASQVEFWRKTEFDGYDVSNFGRVRSHWRRGTKKLFTKGLVIRGNYDTERYNYLDMRSKGNGEPRVHRIVAKAFLPNPKDLPDINHKNATKWDNRLDNLEWTTKSDNVRHATDNGMRERSRFIGVDNHKAKITEDDVREIRRRHQSGERPAEIGADYPISTVKHILAGHTWKHVK